VIEALIAGAIAGYGVAIPVGAIAILIIDAALRRGLRDGLAAGAGAATADGVYATIAGLGGTAVAGVIAPWATPIRAVSVIVLIVIAARGLRDVRGEMKDAGRRDPSGNEFGGAGSGSSEDTGFDGRPLRGADSPASPGPDSRPRPLATYARFVGLTIVNPTTVVYFTALVLGLPAVTGGLAERIAFAVGAFLASISWQSLLAVVGALVHRRLPPQARLYTSVAGNLIVLALAANIARGLIQS